MEQTKVATRGAVDMRVSSTPGSGGTIGFIIASGILLLSVIPQFASWSPDDITIAAVSNADRYAGELYVYTSRPLGAAMFWLMDYLNLDVIRNYQLISVIYAVSFGWFFLRVLSYLSDRAWPALAVGAGAILVCFHGYLIDFNQFKHQYIVVAFVYWLMGLYLLVASRVRPWPLRVGLLVAIGLMENMTYQAATMALVMLVMGRTIIAIAGDRGDQASPARRDVAHLIENLVAIAASCLLYYLVTLAMFAAHVPTMRPPVHLNLSWLLSRLGEYIRAVKNLLIPISGPYGTLNGGVAPIVWAVISIPLLARILATRGVRGFLWLLIVIIGMVLLSQNPEVIFEPTYWPAPRSSFYASFVTPLLLLAGFLAFRESGRRFICMTAVVAILLEVSSTSRTIIDHVEVYGRDLALAREIVRRIVADPTLANATGIKFPASSWNPRDDYFLGLGPPRYDYGSLFSAPWSANALIRLSSGLNLSDDGASTCPTGPRNARTLTLRREGNDIAVCF